MAARVCAWKADLPVVLGDWGEFRMTVRRVTAEDRGEVQDNFKRLVKGVPDAEADDFTAALRTQLEEHVLSVSGVAFEWGEGDTTEPKTVGDLLSALERYEPLRIRESIATLWSVWAEAQFISPFSARRSPSGPASPSGATG